MNLGQILETHLGWAAKSLGFNIATPVFDRISEKERRSLERANLPSTEGYPLRRPERGL